MNTIRIVRTRPKSSDATHNEYALTLTLTENEQTVNTLTNQDPNRIHATMAVDGRSKNFS